MITFDLFYHINGTEKIMCCAMINGDDVTLIGPFPAKGAGPLIVDEMMKFDGFNDRRDVENAYTIAHFTNITNGKNKGGQDYPKRNS